VLESVSLMAPIHKLGWLSSKVVVKETASCGRGCFAIAPIRKDEVVAVMGGHVITLEEVYSL
jgi:hypothetical protein